MRITEVQQAVDDAGGAEERRIRAGQVIMCERGRRWGR